VNDIHESKFAVMTILLLRNGDETTVKMNSGTLFTVFEVKELL
jgi:hypothetical protein